MTEASGQLEVMPLKESIIWKAWARWEEGLRLAHRQWEIGEPPQGWKPWVTSQYSCSDCLRVNMSGLRPGQGNIWDDLMVSKKTGWTGESLYQMPEEEICM